MSTSLLSLPAASLLVSLIGAEAAIVTSGPGTEAGGGITGPDITTGGLGIGTERPSTIKKIRSTNCEYNIGNSPGTIGLAGPG